MIEINLYVHVCIYRTNFSEMNFSLSMIFLNSSFPY